MDFFTCSTYVGNPPIHCSYEYPIISQITSLAVTYGKMKAAAWQQTFVW